MLLKFLFSLFFLFVSCQSDKPALKKDNTSCKTFSLIEEKQVALPYALREISGLGWIEETKEYVAINDESGTLYFLSPDFQLIRRVGFGPPGDYEGIAVADNIIYIIQSNGNIYPYDWMEQKTLVKIKTHLSLKNDVEGLTYNPTINCLVIACKANPYSQKKKKSNQKKGVYFYNLIQGSMSKSPDIVIKDNDIKDLILQNLTDTELSKACKKRINSFAPSAIAYDIASNNYFVLSSSAKLILKMNSDGILLDVSFLPKSHRQPEGLFVTKDRKIVISNEGDGGKAKVFVYDSF